MQFIDTHAHVYSEELLPDLNQLMQNAISSGVTKIFMPAIDSHSLEAMLSVENAFPKNCFSMAGLHPCYVKENVQAELDIVVMKKFYPNKNPNQSHQSKGKSQTAQLILDILTL